MYWRVNGLLHIRAIEVDGRSVWNVVERAGKSKYVPQKGAGGGNLVDIKARIDEQFSVEYGIPEIALAGGVVGRGRVGKRSGGRVHQVFVQKGCVTAGGGLLVEEVHK